MKKIKIAFLLLFTISTINAQTNDSRVITTGVPFLLVAADARSAGMADQGVATSTDVFSQQWNPAKYAFALDKQGFSVSYTPYLTDLVNDISLGQVTYYNRINERSAFAGSLRYFGLGEIELRQQAEDVPQIVKPFEMALDGSYSLKLSERFSMAVAGRYIRSQLRIPSESSGGDAKPASTFAVDIAGFYQSEEDAYGDFNGRWRMGFNFQNLGPKINYDAGQSDDGSANFLPANMKLGGGFDFIFDDYNKVALNIEVAKLLVPTPQSADLNGNGVIEAGEEADLQQQLNADYNKVTWVSGIFKSFGDAPGGFSEELKEFTYSVGAEYLYQDSFAMRLGYFHESPIKGARKFFSLGAGFKYNVVKVDVSYLFSASKVKNPLENTLRFSLTFNFGDKYDEY
ncbi:type IX secretion system outer membrane channel protein PorV [Flavobacterium capsici]|uniref:Type IX secretion system outer membrane channel protein PorV n=1 Tax=Flavobacterium capsici TaxID=3075618 RepID=A0AA96EZQ2_9FLAO|nr:MULTISPECIES: type IX secretion system outer membrane channel protein PorV [unclassified Flavobacterium]WNM20070.1 type IX secretion system outer membrane channel protein PorV [Flavobacterium sp. PMR2A8]WNM21459.1 type IX secretion system outer membrane channel protein PorV [Flavobacterium sp. PMTSA4]